MKNKTLTILIILGILIFSAIILFWPTLENSEDLAKYLGENSTLYISEGCHYCHNQLEILGDSVKYLNIIDCSKNPNQCLEIKKIPTWIINNETYLGFQSIEDLKKIIQNEK